MNLIDNEIINRYIYYLCRYLPYDKKEAATIDVLDILEEKLPKNYTDEDIKKELNNLGNPYEICLKYTNKGNFLLSGKSYEIFISLIYMLLAAGCISLFFFFFNYFARISKVGFLDLVQNLILTTIMLALTSSWICEKVKTTKILKTLTRPWSVDDLYESIGINHSFYGLIMLLIYSSMFFLLQMYMRTGNTVRSTYNIIIFLFFLNILRDALRINENSNVSTVVYVIYIIDLLSIVVFGVLLSFAIPNLFSIRIIMLVNLVDICYTSINLFKNKNIINLRKKRKRDKRNKKNNKISKIDSSKNDKR